MSTVSPPIVIVGAGFAGIGMGIELIDAGVDDFIILEAADEIGGTWRDNTYPGCACDVPSHVYSYSFELNPRWSRAYSPQPEILSYIKECSREHGIDDHIRLEHEVTAATFDAERGIWTVELRDRPPIEARVVVLGVGPLNRPKIPDFPGREDYRGATWHSMQWDHDFELAGKRVGLVGTGASAIQIVPEVAREVDHLAVFQRTPPWVLPKPDRPFLELEKRLFERVPFLQRAYRRGIYWIMEGLASGLITDYRLMLPREMHARHYIRSSFDDPEMREKVTPDYRMGCKRMLFSNDYYPALAEPHVSLVTESIERFTERGIQTRDGSVHELDAVVFATGFHTTDFFSHFEIRGLDGRALEEAWRDGAEAYKGIAVSGFPNLYFLAGPNTSLGHSSIIFMIEAQAHLIRQAIEEIRDEQLRYLDIRPSTYRRSVDEVQERMRDNVWQSGCESWYLDEHGRNVTLWPGYTWEYWLETRRLEREAFRGTW
jgi:cation diffusion facilitator CzcD-associated flavoprotein CzcO